MPHNRVKFAGGNNGNGGVVNVHVDVQNAMENTDSNVTYCCVPNGCQRDENAIHKDDLSGVLKVICNNDNCTRGNCMHRDCFEMWEQTVLTYLKSTGRARSWSEKQRLQNLWTKKGYDLAYKACSCTCGKGHLRKDLDWFPPAPPKEESLKKKKHRKKKNDKPTLNMPMPNSQKEATQNGKSIVRVRTSSISSTCSSSPPSSGSFDSGVGSPSSPCHVPERLKKSRFDYQFALDSSLYRERRDSGGSIDGGLGAGYIHAPNKFTRRQDFSSFSTLPRHKINSYHIKMEDEASHGNDETRNLVLSALGDTKTSKVSCILCQSSMMIFDRYPLIDGTFFLSPRQHSRGCVPIKFDGRSQYLNAVCMGCLEGWNTTLRCRYCQGRWNGSSLILGTMYTYDIFAATPCCPERLKCNNCHRMILMPDQRLQYFSDYSHSISCPRCTVIDFHFIKSLSTYNRRSESLINIA